MLSFATKRLVMKVKVENLTVNELWYVFSQTKPVFPRGRTKLPFIKTKIRQMLRYLRIVTSMQSVAHLEKMFVNATTLRTIWGEAKKTRKKVLSLQRQCMVQFRFIFVFRHIKFRSVRWYLNCDNFPYDNFLMIILAFQNCSNNSSVFGLFLCFKLCCCFTFLFWIVTVKNTMYMKMFPVCFLNWSYFTIICQHDVILPMPDQLTEHSLISTQNFRCNN